MNRCLWWPQLMAGAVGIRETPWRSQNYQETVWAACRWAQTQKDKVATKATQPVTPSRRLEARGPLESMERGPKHEEVTARFPFPAGNKAKWILLLRCVLGLSQVHLSQGSTGESPCIPLAIVSWDVAQVISSLGTRVSRYDISSREWNVEKVGTGVHCSARNECPVE